MVARRDQATAQLRPPFFCAARSWVGAAHTRHSTLHRVHNRIPRKLQRCGNFFLSPRPPRVALDLMCLLSSPLGRCKCNSPPLHRDARARAHVFAQTRSFGSLYVCVCRRHGHTAHAHRSPLAVTVCRTHLADTETTLHTLDTHTCVTPRVFIRVVSGTEIIFHGRIIGIDYRVSSYLLLGLGLGLGLGLRSSG